MSKRLGEVLQDIERIERPSGGRFTIVIACEIFDEDYELSIDTPCEIIFIRNEEDEEYEFDGCELADIGLAQEVVAAAKWMKPQCSQQELVEALRFYLDRDAFMPMNED